MSHPSQGRGDESVPRGDQPTQMAPTGWQPPGQPAQPPQPGASPPPYGAPQHGGPQYGAPQYGVPQYGEQYGAPQYGAPQYGGPQYGAPQYGAPQYGASQYGASPSPYGAPQYGGYPAPAVGGYDVARRPGTVTAAAVIGFVFGGLLIVFCLLGLIGLAATSDTIRNRYGSGLLAVTFVILLVRLAMGGLYIWGGVRALRGQGRTMLIVVSAIELALALIGLVVRVGGTSSTGLVGVIIDLLFVAPILILILLPASGNFFAARRAGRT